MSSVVVVSASAEAEVCSSDVILVLRRLVLVLHRLVLAQAMCQLP